MARALSGSNSLAKALSNGMALMINRRGYSAASTVESKVRKVEEKAVVMKGKREGTTDSIASSSWVPDPVTGYYRPANRLGEVDAADLREVLLSQKSSRT